MTSNTAGRGRAMQPQLPATVRAIPDGPWLPAVIVHQKADGRWLAEMGNGALVEVGPHEIRISAADAPVILREAAQQVERIGNSLAVIPADARNSYYYDACRRITMAYSDLMDAAQQPQPVPAPAEEGGMSRGNNMTIDTKALRERFESIYGPRGLHMPWDESRQEYTDRIADGAFQTFSEGFTSAADRLAALEAENQRLRAQQASLNGTINKLRRENERLEAENQQLLSTFRHSHHRSDNGDSCAQCGLDLRHPIHNRTLASGGDK